MNRHVRSGLRLVVLYVLGWVAGARAASPAAALPDLRNRLLGAERGYVADADWRAAFEEAERLEIAAAASGDWTTAIELAALKARALAWVAGNAEGAIHRLRGARERYGTAAPGEMRRLYLAEAEIRARIGDAAGIRQLMEEFRTGPFFDARPMPYRVLEGRDTPMFIHRPYGGGENSITLTAMGRLLQKAQAAPGYYFPPFELIDTTGRRWSSAQLVGSPLLIAFVVTRSPLWERQQQVLARVGDRHQVDGLDIVIIAMDLDGDALAQWAVRAPRDRWRVVGLRGAGNLPARVGNFGEYELFVIGRDGRILARTADEREVAVVVRRAISGR